MKMKRLTIALFGSVAYVIAYWLVRLTSVEVWERDGKEYVIFGSPFSYYLFRPMSYLDSAMTGMSFHIGPHAEVVADSKYE